VKFSLVIDRFGLGPQFAKANDIIIFPYRAKTEGLDEPDDIYAKIAEEICLDSRGIKIR
jgi:hypothetical protein